MSPNRTLIHGCNTLDVTISYGFLMKLSQEFNSVHLECTSLKSMSMFIGRENGTDDDPVARVETSLPSQLSKRSVRCSCAKKSKGILHKVVANRRLIQTFLKLWVFSWKRAYVSTLNNSRHKLSGIPYSVLESLTARSEGERCVGCVPYTPHISTCRIRMKHMRVSLSENRH